MKGEGRNEAKNQGAGPGIGRGRKNHQSKTAGTARKTGCSEKTMKAKNPIEA